jgi:type III secretion protein Q
MTATTATMESSDAAGTARAEGLYENLLAMGRQARPVSEPEAGLALPAISPDEVASINAFYRRRPAVVFSLAGHLATILASWPPAPGDVSGTYHINITIDTAPGALILSRSAIKALISGLDPDQKLDGLNAHECALLLELAVADALSVLETSLGSRLSIDAVCATADPESGTVSLPFSLAIDGLAPAAAELRLPPSHAVRLAQRLDRGASAARPLQAGNRGEEELPVAVCLRVAAAMCSVGEIATLSPGDIVMADDVRLQSQTAVAVIAEHLVAPVRLKEAGAQIAAAPVRIRGSLWEWSMESEADRQADVTQKTGLDDIPVKLLFELGRVELTLAEIRKLAPGSLIAMPRPIDDSVEIVTNGRRIGRGSLVQIGSNVGVRITRLFQDD